MGQTQEYSVAGTAADDAYVDNGLRRPLYDSQIIDHANPASFQLLRREARLEKLALDGRLTASLLISDLRVDDVLDVAITIRSHH